MSHQPVPAIYANNGNAIYVYRYCSKDCRRLSPVFHRPATKLGFDEDWPDDTRCAWCGKPFKDVRSTHIAEMRLQVQTYNYNLYGDTRPAWGEPMTLIRAMEAEGIRLLLGEPSAERDCPDLYVERQPNGWALFIHPDSGDPVGVFYIHDDGRTFYQSDYYYRGAPPRTEILRPGDKVPGFEVEEKKEKEIVGE